jgi:hypothetical protein
LKSILLFCDEVYYNSDESKIILTNEIYDYVKRIHGQRTTGSMDKVLTMKSISSKTGVGIKPTRNRDTNTAITKMLIKKLWWSSQVRNQYTGSFPLSLTCTKLFTKYIRLK